MLTKVCWFIFGCQPRYEQLLYQVLNQLFTIYRQFMQPQIRKINDTFSICDHKLLGKGSTGNVYLGLNNNDPQHKVAIKCIDLSTIDNPVTKYLLSCEIAALTNLGKKENSGHENIVKLIDIIIERNHLYLAMELLQGGTLSEYIKQHPNGLTQQDATHIFTQIMEAYSHIKSRKIVHRDLKPENILFRRHPNQSKQVAIIDFGYCEMQEVPNKPNMFYNVGSPKYMSPQAYKQNEYSEKSDVWAIGVMLYEMLVGSTCDKGLTMDNYLEMIEKKGIPLPPKLRMFHQHILTSMLHFDHSRRYSCQQIIKELRINSPNMQRQSSHAQLRSTTDVPRTCDPRTKQGLFHSLILPQQKVVNQQNQQIERGLKSDVKIREPNQNMAAENNNQVRFSRTDGFSFHMPQERPQQQHDLRFNKVENVELVSAKQIVHRRHQPEIMIQSKIQQPHHPTQNMPRHAASFPIPGTPLTGSKIISNHNQVFHNNQMTPQTHIILPTTPHIQQPLQSSNFINNHHHPHVHPHPQQHLQQPHPVQMIRNPQGPKSFFGHGPETPRTNAPSLSSMTPQTPGSVIIPRQIRNSQILNSEQSGHHSKQPPIIQRYQQPQLMNKGSMQDLSSDRNTKTVFNRPINIEHHQFQPNLLRQGNNTSPHLQEERQSIRIPPQKEGRRDVQIKPFQPVPPQLLGYRNQDNRSNCIRLLPQHLRQGEIRSIIPQRHLTAIRQGGQ